MTKLPSRVALAGIFAVTIIAAPAAFAEEGKTSTGGTSANSGSSGDKTDRNTQENAASADKNKQHK